jgi:serine/threonine protein kinase
MSLAELIARRRGPIPPAYAFAFIRQALEGLAQAHAVGIVHRDVKPGNLLLGHDGTVKIADLGLAMMVGDRLSRQALAEPDDRGPVGTAAYLAPEQVDAPDQIDFRTDIYSLGCTLYHALTGRLPFEGRSSFDVILKHVGQPPVPPHELVPGLSREASELVLRMMAKSPADRPRSYEELRAELGRVVGDRRAPRPLAESFLSFALS